MKVMTVICLVCVRTSQRSLPTSTKYSRSWRMWWAAVLTPSTRSRYVSPAHWSHLQLPARQLTCPSTSPVSSTAIVVLLTAIPGRMSGKELVRNWNWLHLLIYRVGQKSKPQLIYEWIASYVRKALLFCTLTNSGTTASYIKLFALFVVLNILWYSAADTRMRRSSTRAINTDVQVQFNS